MFNLSNKIKQVKAKIKPFENDLIIAIIIILVALISFGLGRLSKIRENKTPITIENVNQQIKIGENNSQNSTVEPTAENNPESNVGVNDKLYVVSKNGTKYHYPWCSGALNIKEENKIWFVTKEEAEKAGYTPAANCKGL